MTFRWVFAGAAVLALALLTLPFAVTSPRGHAHGVTPVGGVALTATCDSEARPANFDFTLEDMHGDKVALESFKGKVVLLNFWATWCGPCKIEIPWFVEFTDQHKDDGLVVLGVSIDDTAEKIRAFAEDYDVNYPLLVGLGREDFQESYGPIWGIPMTFFIDRQGTLCRTHAGIADREEFEKDISDLL